MTTEVQWPDSWKTLSHGIRSGRYTDPAFAKLEFEKLWSKVWQAAARLDEIPEKGDYTTYDIGDQSVIITRVDADTIKAYHNVCPHRATALTPGGTGHFHNCKIICPFHGWRWNLAGHNEYVLERPEFKDGKLTCWSASQATHNLRKQLAKMMSMPLEDVRCIYVDGAGCYGRNGHEDAAGDSTLLAKAVNRPVRVQWSRADEHGWDPKGPPTLIDLRANVDASGNVTTTTCAVDVAN